MMRTSPPIWITSPARPLTEAERLLEFNPNHDDSNGEFSSGSGGAGGEPNGPRKYAGRAKAGGEKGMNDEDYRGGQFLPNTNLPKGAAGAHQGAPKKIGKRMVEPGKWEVQPSADHESIIDKVGGTYAKMNHSTGDMELTDYYHHAAKTGMPTMRGHSVKDLVDQYNKGVRWFVPK